MNKSTESVEIYDLTPDEKEIINWRAKRRLLLRNKYLNEVHNPNVIQKGHIFDEQFQRHFTALLTTERFFKPNIKNLIWSFSVTFACFGLFASRIKKFRDEKEHRLRTGQISYRNRDWKFV